MISDSTRLFQEAIKDGYVKLNIINMLLSGVAGSGKTSLKLLLTDKPPPPQRNSTPCMEKPVRVNIRPVSSSKIQSTGRGWVETSQEKLLSLLAQIIAKHPKKGPAQSVGMKVTKALQQLTPSSGSTSDLESLPSGESNTQNTEIPPTSSRIGEAMSEVTESLVNEVAQKLELESKPASPIKLNQEGGELFDSTWVYISDCGGQPQFHDISPLFIQHISVAAIVFRLTDDFSSFPLDEYYKDGQLVGLPHASHMTLGETLMSLIRSIDSHCLPERKPKLIFVGTFFDQIVSMNSLEGKNRAVLDMVPANMKKQIVYNERLKHPIFALNLLSREEETLSIAEIIRKAIEACLALEIKVPVFWFFLDFNLQILSVRLDRGVLSKQECLMLAIRFGFEEKHLEAALIFFDKVCIAHCYPSILPNIVFVNAQIPLDKISELAEYAITLRNADTKGAIDGKLKRMAEEGVITLEFLQLDRFRKHYVEGIFNPVDMLLIMKELLVIAPIPLVGGSDCDLSKSEFFMPSLLKSVPSSELEQRRNSLSTISPIAIYFPSGCIRSGVFCCLVVYLIKVHKWEVLLHSGDPVLLAKNCVRFQFPDHPCTINLIDSFFYIEVHTNTPPDIGKKLCGTIRCQILDGIRVACDILHYNNDVPKVSIFCPCEISTEKKHLAKINMDGYWTCMLQADVWGELPSQSRSWLEKPVKHQGK